MKRIEYIVCLLFILLLTGCGAQRKAGSSKTPTEPEPAAPAWHTCLMQGARVTLVTVEDRLSANATMQVVRDSMLVISIMPMLGIEMMRIEATPTEVLGIDKVHGRYARATYSELNKQLTPDINWDILQQTCSGELPTGSETARLVYQLGGEEIQLTIQYPARQLDVPVHVEAARLNKYQQIDISKWL